MSVDQAIILAAGRGTRMGQLTEETPKSMLSLGSELVLERTIRILSHLQINKVIIVIGYLGDRVRSALVGLEGAMDVDFIENPHFDTKPWQYSLALTADELHGKSSLVLEADIVLSQPALESIVNHQADTAVLADEPGTIHPERSVVILGQGDRVEEFVYDQDHEDVYRFIDNRERVLGNSLQVWKFGKEAGETLSAELKKLMPVLDQGGSDELLEVHAINEVIKKHTMVCLPNSGEPWFNLNAEEDLMLARKKIEEGAL